MYCPKIFVIAPTMRMAEWWVKANYDQSPNDPQFVLVVPANASKGRGVLVTEEDRVVFYNWDGMSWSEREAMRASFYPCLVHVGKDKIEWLDQ